jgi:hypothetical protein
MSFNGAQLFFAPKSSLNNSAEADVTAINLFYKSKPLAQNNRSGIYKPGTTVYIVPTVGTPAVPDITAIDRAPFVRVEWDDVATSDDATTATTYRFGHPLPMPTENQYAVIVKFDGDEAFELHRAVSGELMYPTGTALTNLSSDPNIGKYFTYISPQGTIATDGSNGLINSGTASGQLTANIAYLQQFWSASSSTVLKMEVFVARYAVSGDYSLGSYSNTIWNSNSIVTSANGSVFVNIPQHRYEYISFDSSVSDFKEIAQGELCFQAGPLYPNNKNPALISVTAGSNTVTAISNTINWSTLFNLNGTTPEYIVVQSANQYGANADGFVVRQVTNVVSNTVITVGQSIPFTNTVANFLRTPVAVKDQTFSARLFGKGSVVAVLEDSTANSTVRFVNDSILAVSVTTGGTGYSNTDYITFTGFENVAGKVIGGYAAVANVSTNTTGGISAVYMANLGCGFTNTSAISVAISNSSAQPSLGSGATFSYTIGSIIKSENLGSNTGLGGQLQNCHTINLEVADLVPNVPVNNPSGTAYQMTQRLPYYVTDDSATSSGKAYYCDVDGAWDSYDLKNGNLRRSYTNSKSRVMPSWSQELVIPYANGSSSAGLGGSTNGTSVGLFSNASVVTVKISSNNDFTATKVAGFDSSVLFTHYVLNNDYTGENTNYGAAWAKGLEVKFPLANNAFAEDLLVYATAYRPPGANVVAFARLYNTNDSDAFDDKDWTMLQLRSGANTFSSAVVLTDTFDMTWGLPPFPISAFTFVGSANTTLSSATITGSGTSWSTNATANIVANDVVKIYSPLFPNNYMIAVVNSVANDTSFTINKPVSNNGIVGTMVVDKISYPHQVFNNILNSNVAQYYNSGMVEFQTFNVIQLKFVLLSGNTVIVPMLDDIRATAVTA